MKARPLRREYPACRACGSLSTTIRSRWLSKTFEKRLLRSSTFLHMYAVGKTVVSASSLWIVTNGCDFCSLWHTQSASRCCRPSGAGIWQGGEAAAQLGSYLSPWGSSSPCHFSVLSTGSHQSLRYLAHPRPKEGAGFCPNLIAICRIQVK